MRDYNPIFSSELIAAHRAVHPILVREQRPLIGGLIAGLISLATGWGAGVLIGRPTTWTPLVIAAILGIATGLAFRLAVRPIEQKWRLLATLLPSVGWMTYHLSGPHPIPATLELRLGLGGTMNLIGLVLAGAIAWHVSFRMPTQDEIIQRARRLGSAG